MPDYRKTIGTKDKPLTLKTPPGTASYTMHVEEKDGRDILSARWAVPYCTMTFGASTTLRRC